MGYAIYNTKRWSGYHRSFQTFFPGDLNFGIKIKNRYKCYKRTNICMRWACWASQSLLNPRSAKWFSCRLFTMVSLLAFVYFMRGHVKACDLNLKPWRPKFGSWPIVWKPLGYQVESSFFVLHSPACITIIKWKVIVHEASKHLLKMKNKDQRRNTIEIHLSLNNQIEQ